MAKKLHDKPVPVRPMEVIEPALKIFEMPEFKTPPKIGGRTTGTIGMTKCEVDPAWLADQVVMVSTPFDFETEYRPYLKQAFKDICEACGVTEDMLQGGENEPR